MTVPSAAENPGTRAISPLDLTVTAEEGGVELVDRLADEWQALCCEASRDWPFNRPEWIAAFLRAFLPDAKVLLIIVRQQRRLSLVLPLLQENAFVAGIPVRKLRAPVNEHSCWFDAVWTGGPAGDAAVLALWDYLVKLRAWDVLELREVPEDGALHALSCAAQKSGFQVVRVAQRPTPLIPLPDNIEILKQLPRNARLRGKLRQIRREVASQGQLHLRHIRQADVATLERFYEIEASGWKGEEGSAIACDARIRQFYDEIARSAARLGYLSIYLLELNDQLLAAHFGLSLGCRYFSPKVAYNENRKEWAPGHLIVSEILQDCVTRGISAYDITGPDHDWKMKWTAETAPKSQYYIFNKGLRAGLAHLLRFRLRPRLARSLRWMGRGA